MFFNIRRKINVNSEELEQSLRTEFENYLKETIADMQQEVSEFKEKIESALEKQKSDIDEAFANFSEKFGEDFQMDESLSEFVSEHIKLARDEGSKITAAAFEEAEKLKEEEIAASEPVFESVAQFGDMRDAINDISNQDSQSEILKTLVHHATQFTPRGAFFIVKNEHLVGWRMFGTEEHSNPQVVREVFFPVSSKTALSESVETLATIEGTSNNGEDDLLYLNKLGFEESEKMYAIPLVARGRGVAVLYADNGTEGEKVNVEALETLMRVAGLTVEVLASTQIAKTQVSEAPAYVGMPVQDEDEAEEQFSDDYSPTPFEEADESEENEFEQTDFADETDFAEEEAIEEFVAEDSEEASEETSEEESIAYDFQPVAEEEQSAGFDFQPAVEPEEEINEYSYQEEETEEETSWEQPVADTAQDFSNTDMDDFSSSEEEEVEYSASYDSFDASDNYQAGVSDSFNQPTAFESTQFDSFSDTATATEELEEEVVADSYQTNYETTETSYDFETSNETNFETSTEDADTKFGEAFEDEETVQETVAAPPVRSRFADRNVDLPIEVSEDERRLHNDARRFARLLVSEIKLYNEQKVKEGRESSDLYERLREAIDRSREMYDKRVQPPVAAKFDYFNYELINTLAEGDEVKLGASYPGPHV